MAGVSYAVGLLTGRQIDFHKALYSIEKGLPTNWENISRPVDPVENCGLEDNGPLNATSIVELKLVFISYNINVSFKIIKN